MTAASSSDDYSDRMPPTPPASTTNMIVDAILISLSMNCHTALMKFVDTKRVIESIIVSNDGKIRYYDQRFLKHMEENLITEWTRFFNYINTKRPFDTYYKLELHAPKRSNTI